MKVIGFRNSPSSIRYCILEGDENNFTFKNKNGEHRICFPKRLSSMTKKVEWAYREIKRVINRVEPDSIGLKLNENIRTTYSTMKKTAYIDSLIFLLAGQLDITLNDYLYTSLGTNSRNVKSDAEGKVGKTNKYWNKKAADAVVSAWKTIKES